MLSYCYLIVTLLFPYCYPDVHPAVTLFVALLLLCYPIATLLLPFCNPIVLLCVGICLYPTGPAGEGEGAAADLPEGLPDGEHHPQADEPQQLPHGEQIYSPD